MGRAKECELYKFTIKFDEMKKEAPVYREDLTVSEVAIETREPTILFSLVAARYLEERKNRGREGHSRRSHWNLYFIYRKNPFCY